MSRNIWDKAPEDWAVIPTNGGWKRVGFRTVGILGAGLALAAEQRHRGFPDFVGAHNANGGHTSPGFDWSSRLIAFPTKPLDAARPHLSWKGPASLPLIATVASKLNQELLRFHAQIAPGRVWIPMVGCGLGGLMWEDVKPVLCEKLDNVISLWPDFLVFCVE